MYKAALRRHNPCDCFEQEGLKKATTKNLLVFCLLKKKKPPQTISKCSLIHFQTLYIMHQDFVQKEIERSVCMKPLQWIKFVVQHIRLEK